MGGLILGWLLVGWLLASVNSLGLRRRRRRMV